MPGLGDWVANSEVPGVLRASGGSLRLIKTQSGFPGFMGSLSPLRASMDSLPSKVLRNSPRVRRTSLPDTLKNDRSI